MQVTTTVEFPDWDDNSMEEAIIRQAAKEILRVAEDDITTKTREAVMIGIEAQVGEVVQTAIAEPVRRTSSYGEPIGDPIPLRELIVKAAKTWLEAGVNPKDGTPTRYHRDDTVTRAHYYVHVAVKREMEKSYEAAINAAVQEVKDKAGDKIDEMVRESIKRILNI